MGELGLAANGHEAVGQGEGEAHPLPEGATTGVGVQNAEVKHGRAAAAGRGFKMAQQARPGAGATCGGGYQHEADIGVAGSWKAEGQFGNANQSGGEKAKVQAGSGIAAGWNVGEVGLGHLGAGTRVTLEPHIVGAGGEVGVDDGAVGNPVKAADRHGRFSRW